LRTVPREGRNTGSGAPAQTSTRTSTRSASSATRSRRIAGFPSRVRTKSGEKNQPAIWTCELGPLEFRHHPGQRLGTVDQDIERSSRARPRVTGGPVTPPGASRLPASRLARAAADDAHGQRGQPPSPGGGQH
jgi:hypothetical protein